MFFTEGSEKFRKHTIREIRHDHLLNYSEESMLEGTDRTFSKVYVELPYPTHKPFKTSNDLVDKLLKDKAQYNNVEKPIRKRYLKHDKTKIERRKYGSHSYIHLPHYLINWYNEKDPDSTFDCDYNYYYTGGNLEHFQYMNNDYLIRPDLDNTLCILNVLSDEDVINDVAKMKMNFSCDNPIYNINSLQTNDGLYFIMREKHRVNVAKFKKKFKISLKYSKEYKQPILDAKLSADGKLGVIFANTKLSIKDIEKDDTIFSFKNDLKQEVDTFQQFQFLDENSIILMDRRKIKVIDIRSKSEVMCFEPKLLPCNTFYNFTALDNTLLTATRHYILKSDLRSFNEVYHYSHSLSEAPCYLDYTKKDSDTYLTISSQHYDSKVLFTGKSPFSVPYKIPNIRNTLTESRSMYPPLSMDLHLDERLIYSITGLKILNLDGTINLFTSNCFGEIFKQKIYETEPNKLEPVKKLYEWSKTLEKPKATLHLTHFEELGDIRFSLNAPFKQKLLNEYNSPGKADQFLKRHGTKYSNKNVQSKLAKDFISLWEESDEEEDKDVDLPKEETLEKVNNWIQGHNFEDEDQVN